MLAAVQTRPFTIVCDWPQDHYEIVECDHGPEGTAELNHKYPASSGWMIVDSAETMHEAERIIAQHRAEARLDFE